MFLTGSPVEWMTFEHVKISDTDGTVLDLLGLTTVELRNETIIVMKNIPCERSTRICTSGSSKKSEQLIRLFALCIQDTGKKTEPRCSSKLAGW